MFEGGVDAVVGEVTAEVDGAPEDEFICITRLKMALCVRMIMHTIVAIGCCCALVEQRSDQPRRIVSYARANGYFVFIETWIRLSEEAKGTPSKCCKVCRRLPLNGDLICDDISISCIRSTSSGDVQ